MIKRALVSVSDKQGLVEGLLPLKEEGFEIYSTGGTAKFLEEEGFPVIKISDYTGFPEVMDGRVRTLHPKIHMGLLARSENFEDRKVLDQFEAHFFDLLVCNLYPFQKVLDKKLSPQEQIEFIDVGGPSMIRAAAKSFERIVTIVDPSDYTLLADWNQIDLVKRRSLAAKAFSHLSSYDAVVASYLDQKQPWLSLRAEKHQALRYGENPQQEAYWWKAEGAELGLHQAEILQGKALSYNNVLDLTASLQCLQEFSSEEAVAVAVKHTNPCGVACASSIDAALTLALGADPQSVFGGIISLSQKVEKSTAEKLRKLFLECVIAPDWSPEALDVLKTKENFRVLKWPNLMEKSKTNQVTSVPGGFLTQTPNQGSKTFNKQSWTVYGPEVPAAIQQDLELAWKVCAHLKSNAIALVSQGQTRGLGMGQVNRVDSVEQAILRMERHHGKLMNVVLASDGFFPFPDSVEIAARAGIKYMLQPGGSRKDQEVLSKAEQLGVTMILSGERHFKH